jgi:hypothetical protein
MLIAEKSNTALLQRRINSMQETKKKPKFVKNFLTAAKIKEIPFLFQKRTGNICLDV